MMRSRANAARADRERQSRCSMMRSRTLRFAGSAVCAALLAACAHAPSGSGRHDEASAAAVVPLDAIIPAPVQIERASTGAAVRIAATTTVDACGGVVAITSGSESGLFYGAVSLWQLLTAQPGDASSAPSIMAGMITDWPRYRWRGLMLDSARHYQSPEFVKKIIDAMALHKLNTLHWHLTDDQGWRVEIKRYPRLTEFGAWRTPPGPAAAADIDPATGKPRRYGGYYTQEQIRDIVAYAQERQITIVPEIDMPGHMQAAIAAYPELGTGEKPPVSTDWGVH